MKKKKFIFQYIETPLGQMLAISDDCSLYLLEFTERKNLNSQIASFEQEGFLAAGETSVLTSIKKELTLYFSYELKEFVTPIYEKGSPFQKTVWQFLKRIPFGQTVSYGNVAFSLNRPQAYRAVAKAISTNHFAILIPCHRVIHADGRLGGYAGGVRKKADLLKHESQMDL